MNRYVKKSTIEKIGGLDEGYGIGYFEDVDYCKTAEKEGIKIGFCPDVKIYHQNSASFESEAKRNLMRTNKERFFRKWS